MDLFSAVDSYFSMGSIKFYFFYLSYWLRLLLIVCDDVESNPGPGSDKRVRVLYSNIRGLHATLYELAVAGSDYDCLVCAESKVSESPPSLRAPYPLALVAPQLTTEAAELYSWCPWYGSLC